MLRVCGQVQGNSSGADPSGLGFGRRQGRGWGMRRGCAPCVPGRTETLIVVGQPSSSMGPWSGSSKEYSTEKATGFT